VTVEWEYLSVEVEAGLLAALQHPGEQGGERYSAAREFVVELCADKSFGASSAVLTGSVERSAETAFSTQLTVSRRAPYFARVAAVSADGGRGNWSTTFGPIYEACLADQFLAVRAPALADRTCRQCPEDQAVCGGLMDYNVTARAGFWRLPTDWKGEGGGGGASESESEWMPLFAACLQPAACAGWTGAPPRASDGEGRRRLEDWGSGSLPYARAAVPGLVLIPEEREGCAEGNRGVLCSACALGYYNDVGEACVPCGDPVLAGLRVLGVIVFLMVLFAFLLVRGALAGRKADAGSGIVVLKILVNHAQTIAIVSSANVRFPVSLRSFFAATNSGSSVSLQGLSLECVMGPAGKDPFVTSAISLYVLLPATLLYALLVWAIHDRVAAALFACHGACCRQSRREEGLDPNSSQSPGGGTTASEQITPGSSPTHSGESDAIWTNPARSSRESRAPRSSEAVRRAMEEALGSVEEGMGWSARFWRRMQTSAMVVCFMLHAMVTTAAFKLVTCRNVGPAASSVADTSSGVGGSESSGRSRMALFLDYGCDDLRYRVPALAMAVPVLVVFSLGMPLVVGAGLHRYRGVALTPGFYSLWAFAFKGFRLEAIWWEAWVMVRKAMLIATTVLLMGSSAAVQLTSMLFVYIIALTLHAWMRPYADHTFNVVELVALCVGCFTVLLGLYLAAAGDAGAPAEGGVAATVFVVLANVALLVLALAVLLHRSLPAPLQSLRCAALCSSPSNPKNSADEPQDEEEVQNENRVPSPRRGHASIAADSSRQSSSRVLAGRSAEGVRSMERSGSGRSASRVTLPPRGQQSDADTHQPHPSSAV
jgi:hypothetical protein